MSLTEDKDAGTRLEFWNCSILPRTCLLLGQTAWVMPTTTSSCKLKKVALLFLGKYVFFTYSHIGQIFKEYFAYWILGFFELFFLFLFSDSFVSKQSRNIQNLKTVLLKKEDCPAQVPFFCQILGKFLRWIESRKLALLLHVCLLQISYFVSSKKQLLTQCPWIQKLHEASEIVCRNPWQYAFLGRWSIAFYLISDGHLTQ